MDILNKIIEFKKREVAESEVARPLSLLKDAASSFRPRGFRACLEASPFPAIIAEIKKASPSKGIIRANLDAKQTAQQYAENGAACLSVLTDEKFFSGSLNDLKDIRQILPSTPLLRKDFIISEYQIWEALAYGADAILLIVKALDEDTLKSYYQKATELGFDVLIEIHDKEEAEKARRLIYSVANPQNILLGINNRNLSNFNVNLGASEELIAYLDLLLKAEQRPFFVSESGIFTAEDLMRLRNAQANAFLIGEALVKSGDCGANLLALISETRKRLK